MEMTFELKFNKSIEFFENLDNPLYPRHETHLYADFLEFLATFSKDGFISLGDIQDRFFGTKDYSNSGQRDEDESFLKSIFLHLEERCVLFGENYPFIYDVDNDLLKLKDVFSDKNKVYFFLLASSKLNIFNLFKSDLTKEFEFICKDVLSNFLPPYAIVKNFGRNSEYSGNAKSKIKSLASDLNLQVDEYELNQIAERNVQERGLDVVGWMPLGDECMNILIFLAQCACGKDYESKQHDTRRFKNYLKFYKVNPIQILFIPYSLLNINANKFYQSDLIEDDFLIFERKRIIQFYEPSNGFDTYASYEIVNCLTTYKEGIV